MLPVRHIGCIVQNEHLYHHSHFLCNSLLLSLLNVPSKRNNIYFPFGFAFKLQMYCLYITRQFKSIKNLRYKIKGKSPDHVFYFPISYVSFRNFPCACKYICMHICVYKSCKIHTHRKHYYYYQLGFCQQELVHAKQVTERSLIRGLFTEVGKCEQRLRTGECP